MITIRSKSKERGHFDHGWLNTYHTFSFDQYYDPRYMGFRTLRVINEDFVAAGRGFPMHGIATWRSSRTSSKARCKHEDSMGNGSVIRPGDVQRMTAGTGVRHSEKNASTEERVHLLQIWILPDTVETRTGYEQKAFCEDERRGQLRLIASNDGRDGSVTVHQDVSCLLRYSMRASESSTTMDQTRYAWIQVARGSVSVNGENGRAG